MESTKSQILFLYWNTFKIGMKLKSAYGGNISMMNMSIDPSRVYRSLERQAHVEPRTYLKCQDREILVFDPTSRLSKWLFRSFGQGLKAQKGRPDHSVTLLSFYFNLNCSFNATYFKSIKPSKLSINFFNSVRQARHDNYFWSQ